MTDREIEKLWEEIEYTDDTLFEEGTDGMVLSDDWNGFKRGTSIDRIWDWFDEHYSKGVDWLMNEYKRKVQL